MVKETKWELKMQGQHWNHTVLRGSGLGTGTAWAGRALGVLMGSGTTRDRDGRGTGPGVWPAAAAALAAEATALDAPTGVRAAARPTRRGVTAIGVSSDARVRVARGADNDRAEGVATTTLVD